MFTAGIANYFGHGNERLFHSDGGWSLSALEFRLGRRNVQLRQRREILQHKLSPGGFVKTTTAHIERIDNLSQGVSSVNDLARLLSFAALTQVVPYSYKMGDRCQTISVTGRSWHFRPVLPINEGDIVAAFLERTWANYRRLNRSRKLAEVFEMLSHADIPEQPIEIKLAQIFIILENLKSTYARERGYPFVKGSYRKLSAPPKSNAAKEQPLHFQQLLNEMFKEVGMAPSMRRLITLRNEIVHFGLSRRPFSSLLKHYDQCQDIVREYLLRLLGYEGRYLIYSTACRSESVL